MDVGYSIQGFKKEAPAPLAQSVERFHGKEKVNSSILLGGSVLLLEQMAV